MSADRDMAVQFGVLVSAKMLFFKYGEKKKNMSSLLLVYKVYNQVCVMFIYKIKENKQRTCPRHAGFKRVT